MHAILVVFIGLALSLAGSPVVAAVNPVKLVPDSGLPGATVAITGKGFGAFKSTRANQVKFHGLNALVQRWEPDLI